MLCNRDGGALRETLFVTLGGWWLCFRTMHLGSILNGLGGPVTMAGPAVLSAVWFPTHERTTATAIGAIMSGLGNGVSFLLGRLCLYIVLH